MKRAPPRLAVPGFAEGPRRRKPFTPSTLHCERPLGASVHILTRTMLCTRVPCPPSTCQASPMGSPVCSKGSQEAAGALGPPLAATEQNPLSPAIRLFQFGRRVRPTQVPLTDPRHRDIQVCPVELRGEQGFLDKVLRGKFFCKSLGLSVFQHSLFCESCPRRNGTAVSVVTK